jgi:hypothetical protein
LHTAYASHPLNAQLKVDATQKQDTTNASTQNSTPSSLDYHPTESNYILPEKSSPQNLRNTFSSPGNAIQYDLDSSQIALNNCISTCFTNSMDNFCEKPTKISQTVRGLGKALVTYKGAVRWSSLNNQGRQHNFTISNTHYHPMLPFRLLSPQRIAQIRKDLAGTGTITSGSHVKL